MAEDTLPVRMTFRWFLLEADRLSQVTAGSEFAALWKVFQAGHAAADCRQADRPGLVGWVRTKQSLGIGMLRAFKYAIHLASLNHAPGVEHNYLIA